MSCYRMLTHATAIGYLSTKVVPARLAVEQPIATPVVSNRAPTQSKRIAESVIQAASGAQQGAAQVKQATIDAARFDADYLQNPSPRYPPLARRLREQRLVMLRVHMLPYGLPSKVDVKQSSGSPRLNGAALEAVSQWCFVPARQGDDLVASWVEVPVSISLGV